MYTYMVNVGEEERSFFCERLGERRRRRKKHKMKVN
jgi:hypothetical protein